MNEGWIGVDLDGTLAIYNGWKPDDSIGEPIPLMIERVKGWIKEDKKVKIVTARVCISNEYSLESEKSATVSFSLTQTKLIRKWCKEHIGRVLPVTCQKDFNMIELWDDRVVRVKTNTGEIDLCPRPINKD